MLNELISVGVLRNIDIKCGFIVKMLRIRMYFIYPWENNLFVDKLLPSKVGWE